MTDTHDCAEMRLESVIGFNGCVPNGLKVHPDNEHLIYPLGNTVCIEHITSKKICELSGHTNSVSCIAVSSTGRYIASGQINHMGFKADIIVWDYQTRKCIQHLTLHKVKVQDLAFSPNERYLVSLGGQDDGSVVVWDLSDGSDRIDAICGHSAQVESAGVTHCVAFAKRSNTTFVTGGEGTLRVWELDAPNRKIWATDVNMGNFKRIIKCILVADEGPNPFIACGTSTGDIIGINYTTKILQINGPVKDLFKKGVTALALLKDGEILCGAGDGEVAIVQFLSTNYDSKKGHDIKGVVFEKKRSWRDKNLKSLAGCEITSLALRGQGHQFFIGSANCQIYRCNFCEFKDGSGNQTQINKKTGLKIEKKSQTDDDGIELIKTCHSKGVRDVVFAHNLDELIVTCQYEEIRVWNTSTKKELVRHVVANKTCNGLCLTMDGKTIHSAWDDGVIRGYGFATNPYCLKDKYTRENAHSKGVTAIACTSNGQTLVTGGGEGQVRIWNIAQCVDAKGKTVYILKLVETMMEHKGKVSDVQITKNDKECATASNDGTCIIWDLVSKNRISIFFANTLFKCCAYDTQECQLVTSGTDRKIGFYEARGTSDQIRQLDGATTGAINSICVSPDGDFLVTGGEDNLVKVWTYQTGNCIAVGKGHSDSVTKVKVSPRQRFIVSVSEDGAILFWEFPFNISQGLQQTRLH